jgi:hypothetical protein
MLTVFVGQLLGGDRPCLFHDHVEEVTSKSIEIKYMILGRRLGIGRIQFYPSRHSISFEKQLLGITFAIGYTHNL